MSHFQALPVELIAIILGLLDLASLKTVSLVSSRLRAITADNLLNPWQTPILRALSLKIPNELHALQSLPMIPRRNWVAILTYASPDFLLFQVAIPNLTDDEFRLAFHRRFLPSWKKIRKEGKWREAYMKMLYSVYHRLTSNCTTSEAWTNYIIINRTGVANSTAALSRSFNPVALFGAIKANANMGHLPTTVRLLVRLSDVRVVVYGVLHRNSSLFVNPLAEILVNPDVTPPPEIGQRSDRSTDTDVDSDQYASTQTSPSLLEIARRSRSASYGGEIPSPNPNTATTSFWRTRSRDSAPSSAYLAAQNSQHSNIMYRLFSNGTRSRNRTRTNDLYAISSESSIHVTHIGQFGHFTPSAGQQAELPNGSARKELSVMQYPTPHFSHSYYPNYTPGSDEDGETDWRWYGTKNTQDPDDIKEVNLLSETKSWAGPVLVVAQLYPTNSPPSNEFITDEDDMSSAAAFNRAMLSISSPPTPGRWASFGWPDLWAIAPWLQERISKRVDGIGLGIE